MSQEVICTEALSRKETPRRSSTSPPPATPRNNALPLYYQTLFDHLGPQNWWPARTPFEVIVGAILTQNTSWSNVERAISNLRRERLLTPRALERVPFARLASLIRCSGYF